MTYPRLEIYKERVYRNATTLLNLCSENGVVPVAVIKGHNAHPSITDMTVKAGFEILGSSRISHLSFAKRRYDNIQTMLLRLPMFSEVDSVVADCDISLNSQLETLERLNDAAQRQNRTHGVLLMRDLGDLREGIFDAEECIQIARKVEKELPSLKLCGIGVNLGCYGSIQPTVENLSLLVENAHDIEDLIGRKLDMISGGASSSLPLLLDKTMPKGVNQLRIGGALLMRSDIPDLPEDALPNLTDETLIFEAEIIEIGQKPTHPIGVLGRDCFGNRRQYHDRGIRRRAILAAGAFDIGDASKLIPLDPQIEILGASSDHMIIDIHDSQVNYQLGDSVRFTLMYQSMLFSTTNPLVEKVIF